VAVLSFTSLTSSMVGLRSLCLLLPLDVGRHDRFGLLVLGRWVLASYARRMLVRTVMISVRLLP
jgi:hypothetical protein